MTRRIFIHHHIFKNAGSTVDFILEKNFKDKFATLEIDDAAVRITPSRLIRFLEENTAVRAITGHHLNAQNFQSEPYVFFDILFVRHPIDRLRSIYDYYRRMDPAGDVIIGAANRLTLGEFLNFLIESYPNQVNDAQVNVISNHGKYQRPPGDVDFDRAVGRLREVSFLGSLELFDESLVAAGYFLTPAWGALDLTYKAQNISASKLPDLEDRLAQIRTECGSKLYSDLLNLNQLDLKLIDVAETEIRRRARLVPDFDSKLAIFKRACQKSGIPIEQNAAPVLRAV